MAPPALTCALAETGADIRVLVAGSQLWTDHEFIWDELYRLLGEYGRFTLIHGDCPTGADHFADTWAYEVGLDLSDDVERYPADWARYKKAAGYRRNAEMIKLGADLCVVFILDESPGSEHTLKLAKKAGIRTIVHRRTSMNLPVKRVEDELTLRDVRLIFKNFEGKKKLYNEEGQRNFSIWLDSRQAAELRQIGWNTKLIKRTAEFPEEDREWHLKVNVSYREGTRHPRIFFITKSTNSRNPIDEEFVKFVDTAQFDRVDVTISPYNHTFNGGGVTAYLRTMYGVLHEDPLDLEYSEYQLPGEPIENRVGPLELESGEDNHDVEIVEDSGWEEEEN